MVIDIIIPFDTDYLQEQGYIGDIVAAFDKDNVIIGEHMISPDKNPRIQQWAYLQKLGDTRYLFTPDFQLQPKKINNKILKLPDDVIDLLCEISPKFRKNLKTYSATTLKIMYPYDDSLRREQNNQHTLNALVDDRLR